MVRTGNQRPLGCSPAVARQLWKRLEVEGIPDLELDRGYLGDIAI